MRSGHNGGVASSNLRTYVNRFKAVPPKSDKRGSGKVGAKVATAAAAACNDGIAEMLRAADAYTAALKNDHAGSTRRFTEYVSTSARPGREEV